MHNTNSRTTSSLQVPLLLLVVSLLSYGVMLPRLGFAWDDLVAIWIRYELGAEALMHNFAISRPLLGWFFLVSTEILPPEPAVWHIFAIFWRWVAAVLFWILVDRIWQERSFLAAASALLFLVYPGFSQQSISFVYSHYFIILCCFLLSLNLTLLALRRPEKYWAYTVPALLLSCINLLALEYFFSLEGIRFAIILLAINASKGKPRGRAVWFHSLPYLGILLFVIFYKVILSPNQIYTLADPGGWVTDPGGMLLLLVNLVAESTWLAGGAAWSSLFRFPAGDSGFLVVYLFVSVLAAFLTFFFSSGKRNDHPVILNKLRMVQPLWLGMVGMLLAGWPFWLIQFQVSLTFPNDRFTLSFMLGACLLAAGLIDLLPVRIAKYLLLSILIGMAAGRQVFLADGYAREWEMQKSLFWQMSWRIPGLEPGTLVFLNDGALDYYADNSLLAPLNWIYAPQTNSGTLDYLLFHPRSRLGGSLPALVPDTAVIYDRYSIRFEGTTSRSLALEYAPPGCLRVLDPLLDPVNPAVDKYMQSAASLSDVDLILMEGEPILPELYGSPGEENWCYFYAQAGLAFQQENWAGVVDRFNAAFSQGWFPSDPDEYLILIEAAAHIGTWDQALAISLYLSELIPELDPMLSLLWQRIDSSTSDSPEKQQTLYSLPDSVFFHP